MPRFMVYAPDYPNVLEARMKVRPRHVERAKPDLAGGVNVYGGAFLPKAGSKAREAKLPEGAVNYAGSFMVYIFPTVDDVWARLKSDVFWTEGIWDKERVIVEELID
ncbi:hypothetical protein BCR39DRAFT_273513 [Naematelia encephala]|uniref:YCII-related domain-containing protein n=1 Tax=Naematelia encephala TaxID=71784 RepID=A0A1Y2ATY7_9TREE|nr:hypothetical protein BCR39DRAFT_273513 [Naematelia encephala]